ncbi:DUF1801 domain-containing protein [Arsenicibacter rosenii]|uniref:Uncharacterized protein n=1 Tax=Arsenicibacter rosenii TaxID=1750698 RepID=A0A1S2VMF2_9BACT|nr:DUF1801 domain-containing protein [Arsenicibacter rosenii]OIN59570.1 hypothetical protein BLX24_06760 [Arsenicibacter rosenii]
MNIQQQINDYITSLPDSRRSDLQALHQRILQELPDCRLWFLDGKDETGKTVSNPSIGYGFQRIVYADGKTKDFYQAGISAPTTGISVYIMGLKDKKYLANTFGSRLGKATVTSYCIKFKNLKAIDVDVLLEAIKDGIQQTS